MSCTTLLTAKHFMISLVGVYKVRWRGRVGSYSGVRNSDCLYNLFLILRAHLPACVSQGRWPNVRILPPFPSPRGHFMAHHAPSAAEPSMGSLMPPSVPLYLPHLLATPPPPLSSFPRSLLTPSLSEELCVLAKSIWFGWKQTGWLWRAL